MIGNHHSLQLIKIKVKSCYNPLRLGTVIVLVSSGTDFVNTKRLYSDRATRLERLPIWPLCFVPEGAQSAWTSFETNYIDQYERIIEDVPVLFTHNSGTSVKWMCPL